MSAPLLPEPEAPLADALSDYLLHEAEELARLDARVCPGCGYCGGVCECGEGAL